MQFQLQNKQTLANFGFFILLAALMMASSGAFAGTDATFGSAATGPLGTMTGWLTGSLGKMFAVGALATGLGIGIVKQSAMSVAVGVGIALAASAGPTVLTSIFSAAL
jgi:conjugal transfer pilus assembly protein TraA